MAAVTKDELSQEFQKNNQQLLQLFRNEFTARVNTIDQRVTDLETEVKETAALANFADHAIYAETRSYERNVLVLGVKKSQLKGEKLKEHDYKLAFDLVKKVVRGQNFGWNLTSFHIEHVVRLVVRPYHGSPANAPKYANCDKLRLVMLDYTVANTLLKCARIYSEPSNDENGEPIVKEQIVMVREVSQAKRDYLDYCHHQKNLLNADPNGTKWHSVIDDYVKPGRKRNEGEAPKPMPQSRGRRGGRGGRRGRYFQGLGRDFLPHNHVFGGNPGGDNGSGSNLGGAPSSAGGSSDFEFGLFDQQKNQRVAEYEKSKFCKSIRAASERIDKNQYQHFTLSPCSRAMQNVSVENRRQNFERKNTVSTTKRTASDMSPENNSGFNEGTSKSKPIIDLTTPSKNAPCQRNDVTLSSTPRNPNPFDSFIDKNSTLSNTKPVTPLSRLDALEEEKATNDDKSDSSSDSASSTATIKDHVENESEIQSDGDSYSLCPPSQITQNSDDEDEVDFLKNGRPIRSVLGENKLLPNELYDLWLEKYHTLKQKQATCKEDMFSQLTEDGELIHFLAFTHEDTELGILLEEWCHGLTKMIEPFFNDCTVNIRGYKYSQFTEKCQLLRTGNAKPTMYSSVLHGTFLTKERNFIISRTKSSKKKEKLRKKLNKNLDSSILFKDGNLVFSPAKF